MLTLGDEKRHIKATAYHKILVPNVDNYVVLHHFGVLDNISEFLLVERGHTSSQFESLVGLQGKHRTIDGKAVHSALTYPGLDTGKRRRYNSRKTRISVDNHRR